jgi:hypothetical protein
MTHLEVSLYLSRHAAARRAPPAGWQWMRDLPIRERRPMVDYLMADGTNRLGVLGVSHADLIISPGVAVAWRRSVA